MFLKIINKSTNPLPSYQTSGSAGLDLRAFLEIPLEIDPLERKLVPTGLFFEMQEGYEAQIRSRSGLTLNSGLIVPNSPGTIDSDYRGEIKIIIFNISDKKKIILSGDRIAQIVFSEIVKPKIEEVKQIDKTKRNNKGFGSTGIK